MRTPGAALVLVLLAGCGEDAWLFEYEDGPLEGPYALALQRTDPRGPHLIEAGQRQGRFLPADEEWGAWDLSPGLDRIVRSASGSTSWIERATGARSTLGLDAVLLVRFSPTGDRIAAIEPGRLVVVELDGSIVRERPLPKRGAEPGLVSRRRCGRLRAAGRGRLGRGLGRPAPALDRDG